MREPDISRLLIDIYNTVRRYGVKNIVGKLKELEQKDTDTDHSEAINLIVNLVCKEYDVWRKDLLSKKRGNSLSEAKKMVVVLVAENVPISYREIAWYFNRHNRSVYRVLEEYQNMSKDIKWQRDFLEKKEQLTTLIKTRLNKNP